MYKKTEYASNALGAVKSGGLERYLQCSPGTYLNLPDEVTERSDRGVIWPPRHSSPMTLRSVFRPSATGIASKHV